MKGSTASYCEIPLTKGQIAIVDTGEYGRLNAFKWQAVLSKNGKCFYAQRYSSSPIPRTLGMHREVLGMAYGDGLHVDHVNGNTLDNRRENLRVATRSQNSFNSMRPNAPSGGYRGVYIAPNGRYIAKIRAYGKQYHLGTFKTAEEARDVRLVATLKMHGEFTYRGLLERTLQR